MGKINGIEGPVYKGNVETVYITGKNAEGKAVTLAANFDADDDPTTTSVKDLRAASEAIAKAIKLAEARGVVVDADASISVYEKNESFFLSAFREKKFEAARWMPFAAKIFSPPEMKPVSAVAVVESPKAPPPESILPSGIDKANRYIVLSDLPELYDEKYKDAPAEDMAAIELQKHYVKEGKADPEAIFKAVAGLPEQIPVVWYDQGKLQGPAFIKKADLIASLETRGVKRPAIVATPAKISIGLTSSGNVIN